MPLPERALTQLSASEREQLAPLWFAWQNLMAEMDKEYKSQQTGHIIPIPFVRTLMSVFSDFPVGIQNDIHEMYLMIMNRVVEESAVLFRGSFFLASSLRSQPEDEAATEHANPILKTLRTKCNRMWLQHFKNDQSPFIPHLYGQHITQITCGGCRKIHHAYDPFLLLEVPLTTEPATGPVRLESCIYNGLADENVSDWKCDACQVSVVSSKVHRIWKLPTILTFCVKRFEKKNGVAYHKNEHPIEAPVHLKLMSLENSLENQNHRRTYLLQSVAIHSGGLHGGHYYTYVRRPDGWWCINDSTVCRATDSPTTLPKEIADGYLYVYEDSTASLSEGPWPSASASHSQGAALPA